MTIKSILVWPREVCLGWSEDCENKSEDTHHSQQAAEAVCLTLISKGLGCDGKHFPVDARVEVDGVVTWDWKNRVKN
jgi:hypothetical protein